MMSSEADCVTFLHFRVHADFEKVITDCYAPYSPGAEDKNPFGLKNGSA